MVTDGSRKQSQRNGKVLGSLQSDQLPVASSVIGSGRDLGSGRDGMSCPWDGFHHVLMSTLLTPVASHHHRVKVGALNYPRRTMRKSCAGRKPEAVVIVVGR